MKRSFNRFVLDPSEVMRWKEITRRYDYPSGDTALYTLSPDKALAEVRAARRPLNDPYIFGALIAQATTPAAVTDVAADFGRPGGPDAVLIDLGSDAIEIDPDKHMPVRGRRNPAKPFSFDEIALLGAVLGAGFPMSLIPEAGLDLIMPVSPAPGTKRHGPRKAEHGSAGTSTTSPSLRNTGRTSSL